MTRFARILAIVAFATLTAQSAGASADFPVRPARAPLQYVDGVLKSWGVGNRSGEIVVQTLAGFPRRFAVSDAIVVDGKPVRCAFPPKPGEKPDPTLCDSWPSGLMLGRSRVRVAYWHDARAQTAADRDVVASLKTL